MNKSVLIGNLTRDPELKTTAATGVSVCNFTIAVSRRFKNAQGEKETDFIPIVVWRATAELCAKYLRKGSQVAVVGAIQTRNYEAQDGSRRYVTEIVADEVQFIGKPADRHEDGGSYEPPADSTVPPPMSDIDEDLPF